MTTQTAGRVDWSEKARWLRRTGKVSTWPSENIHPTLRLCIDAQRAREAYRDCADGNAEMEAVGGWKNFPSPERMRQFAYQREAELRLDMILAEDAYERAADADDQDWRDEQVLTDALRHGG